MQQHFNYTGTQQMRILKVQNKIRNVYYANDLIVKMLDKRNTR